MLEVRTDGAAGVERAVMIAGFWLLGHVFLSLVSAVDNRKQL